MGGEVFTKAARRQRAGKLGLPVVQLFAGVGVDGFIIAAMMLGVTNYIAAHAGTIAIMGAGRGHIDEGLRLLVDARKLGSGRRTATLVEMTCMPATLAERERLRGENIAVKQLRSEGDGLG